MNLALSRIEINLLSILSMLIFILFLSIITVRIISEIKKKNLIKNRNIDIFNFKRLKQEVNKLKENYQNSILIISIENFIEINKNLNHVGIEKYINAFNKEIKSIYKLKVITTFDLTLGNFIIYMPYVVKKTELISIKNEIEKISTKGIKISNRLLIKRNVNSFGIILEDRIDYQILKANIDLYFNNVFKKEADFLYLNIVDIINQLEKEI